MPQIIVTADNPRAHGERAVMFTERVSSSDFESGHFQAQLVERLGWAVGDADALELERPELADGSDPRQLERAEEMEAEQLEPAEEMEPDQLEPAGEQQQIESASTPRILTHPTT